MTKTGSKYRTKHDAKDLKQMVIMRGTGHTQKEIGDKLGMSPQKVGYHLKKLKKRSEKDGVDETLTTIFIGAAAEEFEWQTDKSIAGLVLMNILSATEWWSDHYRINSHWLIQRLYQLCTEEDDKNLEQLKKIVMSSLPNYAKSYGLNLEEWAESRKNRKVVQND